MPCHGLFPNNPRSHCMCGLFPGHFNKSFARTALSGLPHGHLSWGHEGTAALARTAWSPALSSQLDASHHQQPCFPTALRTLTLGGCSVLPRNQNFSDRENCQIDTGSVIQFGEGELLQLPCAGWLLRLLSGPVFPFFYPCPSGHDDALTQGWLSHANSSLFSGSVLPAEEDYITLTTNFYSQNFWEMLG